MTAGRQSQVIEEAAAGLLCQWFLLCRKPATGTTPHPILGHVPTCDRCAARAEEWGR